MSKPPSIENYRALINLTIGTPEIKKTLRVKVPIAYNVGSVNQSKIIDFEINDQMQGFELIKSKLENISSEGFIQITLDDLLQMPELVELIEDYLHNAIKEDYRSRSID